MDVYCSLYYIIWQQILLTCIFTMIVPPILVYGSTVKFLYKVTQQNKLKSLESRAEHFTGWKIPYKTSTINKEACYLVKKSLDETEFSMTKLRLIFIPVKLTKINVEPGKQSITFNKLPLCIRKLFYSI